MLIVERGHMVGNAHWILNPAMFSYLANVKVLRKTSCSVATIIAESSSVVSTRNTVSEKTAYPASLIDAFTAWLYLTEEMGYEPKNIALMGDSAGGGLCHVLIMLLMKYNLETPGKVILDSPMINAEITPNDVKPYDYHPPDLLSARMIDWAWSAWTVEAKSLRTERFMSPGSRRNLIRPGDPQQRWDLKGYPDVLLMYGTGEKFHKTGDFENFAASLEARNVRVVKHVMPNMVSALPTLRCYSLLTVDNL
jgi:acetyl esterase/lipase